MSGLEIDFETKSAVDLKTHGVYVYMASATTEPLMASYKIDGGPVRRWRPPAACPDDIVAHVTAGGIVSAHNNAFERLLWQNVLTPRYGWPVLRLEQCRCTAATAAAMALPRDLKGLGEALGLEVQKDKSGMALIRKFSILKPGAPVRDATTDPEDFERFHDYCDVDVETEAAADRRMVPLSNEEQEIYWLSEKINDRGLRIDTVSARAAVEMIAKAKERVNSELKALTGGRVSRVTETAALKRWILTQGVEIPSMDKDDVDDFLESDDLPPTVRRALELRQEGAKPSVEKISSMLDRVSADGRARGVYLHHGAGQTGRFSSRGVQAHNMPKYRKVFENAKPELSVLFQAIRTADPDWIEFLYGPDLGRPLHLLSDAVRSFIWSAPGYDLLDADYSSIEGRMAAWFAGEDWKLDAFRALDRGEGHGIYELAAAGIYGIPIEAVTKQHRPTGKVAELSCLSADTPVLTDRGVVAIKAVLTTDRLWDGVEWVSHAGVVANGVRPVVDVDGIRATPDHLIKTGPTWRPAGKIASDPVYLAQALETGSERLPSSISLQAPTRVCAPSLSDVIAEPRLTRSTSAIFGAVRPLVAKIADSARALRRGRSTLDTLTSFLTKPIGDDCSDASLRASTGARTRGTAATLTTVGAAFASIGDTIGARFWSTSLLCQDGTDQSWNSIAPTSMAATRPEISASLRARRTQETDVSPEPCKPASCNSKPKTLPSEPVFDILNAGPRHRFTVFSNSGALLVHNCQYQTGVGGIKKFARQSKIKLPTLYPALWEAAEEEQREFVEKRFADRQKAHDPNTEILGREGWIAAELIKVGWRAKHPGIVQAWSLLEEAATGAVEEPGRVTMALGARYVVAHGFLWCQLPSGRCLAYGAPRMDDVEAPWADKTLEPKLREKKRSVTVMGVDEQSERWVRFSIYGGSLFNNLVQGSARDILVRGIQNAEAAGYPVVLHTHDEMAAEVPRGWGDVKDFERIICELPDWAAGLPLTASGWRGKRYRKD